MQKAISERDVLAAHAGGILARDIGWRMLKYKKLLAREYKSLYEQLGFTFVETTIMLEMTRQHSSSSLCAANIARDYGLDPSAVCRGLTSLVRGGLVTQQPDTGSNYQKITLTENGYRTLETVIQQWSILHRHIAESYGMYDIEVFDRLLIKIGKISG